MTEFERPFQRVSKLEVDTTFKPDILGSKLVPVLFDMMHEHGISTVASPVSGLPPRRYALWYGTQPTPNEEVPVILVGSHSSQAERTSWWRCGFALASVDYDQPAPDTIERYSEYATVIASGPESAFVRSVFMIGGKTAIPGSLLEYI